MTPRDVAQAIADKFNQEHDATLDADLDVRASLPDGLTFTAYSGGDGQFIERFEIRITKVSG